MKVSVGDCFRLMSKDRYPPPELYPAGCVFEVRDAAFEGEENVLVIALVGTHVGFSVTKAHLLGPDFHADEKPVMSREKCISWVRHGGASWQMSATSRTFCMTCQTEVTTEDLERRVRDLGGPGHWIGCALPKDHDGDCSVPVGAGN